MKPKILSDRSLRDLAEVRRRVLGVSPAQTAPVKRGGSVAWYWGELIATLDAPADGWASATQGYCKLMVPDPTSVADPVEFVEMGKGTITGATNASPIVITSADHHRQEGDLVYITDVAGNTAANGPWRVTSVTQDTFALIDSTGNGAYSAGGTWYLAEVFSNRSPSLSGSAGTLCKLEWAWGEWSLKWIDC